MAMILLTRARCARASFKDMCKKVLRTFLHISLKIESRMRESTCSMPVKNTVIRHAFKGYSRAEGENIYVLSMLIGSKNV